MVRLTAQSNPGYFFQSWSGDVTRADSVYTFTINQNVKVTAIFFPNGITMNPSFIGYGTIQDDRGTPYLARTCSKIIMKPVSILSIGTFQNCLPVST